MVGYQPFLNIISCCLRHCIQGARGRWGCVLKFLLSIFTRGRGTAKFPWAPTCPPSDHWIVMLYKHVPCLDCCWPRPDCRKGPSVPGTEVIKGWKESWPVNWSLHSGQSQRGYYHGLYIFLILEHFLSPILTLCAFGKELLNVYELDELHSPKVAV